LRLSAAFKPVRVAGGFLLEGEMPVLRPFMLSAMCSSALVVCLLPASAQTSLPVNNAGFEEPQTNTFTTSIPGWSGVAEEGVHSFAFVASQYLDVAPPEGAQFGYLNSGAVFQDIPEVITAGQRYTLTGWVGRRNDSSTPIGTASLFTMSGAVLASTGALSTPAGRFTEFSLSFTAEEGGTYLGQGLRVQLANLTDNQQINFDKIALTKTAVVPAPASLLTALMGAIPSVMVLRSRRRK
jgi:hypothetical protein